MYCVFKKPSLKKVFALEKGWTNEEMPVESNLIIICSVCVCLCACACMYVHVFETLNSIPLVCTILCFMC